MPEASTHDGGHEPREPAGTAGRAPGAPVHRSPLTIRREGDGPSRTLRLAGELDMSHIGVLDGEISALCAEGARSIVLELGELTFMDSTGVRDLLLGLEACERVGCRLALGTLSRPVRRVLDVSGVGERLDSAG